jgi:hypothetical protein
MLYSICFILSVWIFGIAEIGIALGSPPGTTTEVQRVGFPSAENRFVSSGHHLVIACDLALYQIYVLSYDPSERRTSCMFPSTKMVS